MIAATTYNLTRVTQENDPYNQFQGAVRNLVLGDNRFPTVLVDVIMLYFPSVFLKPTLEAFQFKGNWKVIDTSPDEFFIGDLRGRNLICLNSKTGATRDIKFTRTNRFDRVLCKVNDFLYILNGDMLETLQIEENGEVRYHHDSAGLMGFFYHYRPETHDILLVDLSGGIYTYDTTCNRTTQHRQPRHSAEDSETMAVTCLEDARIVLTDKWVIKESDKYGQTPAPWKGISKERTAAQSAALGSASTEFFACAGFTNIKVYTIDFKDHASFSDFSNIRSLVITYDGTLVVLDANSIKFIDIPNRLTFGIYSLPNSLAVYKVYILHEMLVLNTWDGVLVYKF